jgi:hypothetical protein
LGATHICAYAYSGWGATTSAPTSFPAQPLTPPSYTLHRPPPPPSHCHRCRGAGPDDLTDCTEWLVGFPWSALDQKLEPSAEAEPQWNVFRPKCEALARRFFSPDAGAEEVEFEAPAYYGENRWCADWDFMCTAGCSVADAREEQGKPGLARKNSVTHGSL